MANSNYALTFYQNLGEVRWPLRLEKPKKNVKKLQKNLKKKVQDLSVYC